MNSKIRWLIPLALAAAVGCSSQSSSSGFDTLSPSSVATPFLGTWNGTVNLSLNGTASLKMTIGASGSRLTGDWAMTFSNGSPAKSGTLAGGVNADGSTMSVDLMTAGVDCPPVVSGTINGAGTQMTGKYDAAATCGAGPASPLVLSKQ